MNDQRETRWLVFAAVGDSMQRFPYPDGSYLDMEPPSAGKFVAEHSHGADATWIRPQFGRAGRTSSQSGSSRTIRSSTTFASFR